jgi:DNA polymerase-3 subunit delta'
VSRDGIAPALAKQVAAEAQSHIGMARRLGTSVEARGRRKDTLMAALSIDSISSAMFTADRWLELAKKDADALTIERDTEERDDLLRALGVEDASKLPPHVRADVRALEESQKRRATRSLRDGLDRILVDLLSLFRDVLMLQLGAQVPLVNEDLQAKLHDLANKTHPEDTLFKLKQIEIARTRIASNVNNLMVLESLAVNFRVKK